MKRFFLFLMLPLLVLSFVACSDDDGNDDDVINSTKLVKSINEGYITTFEYDSQNRISKTIWDEDGLGSPTSGGSYVTSTFDYQSNKTIVTSVNKKNPSDSDVMTLHFENGYLTKVEYSDYYEAYTYSNGYLTTIVYSEDGYTESFTWNNGNITKITSSAGEEWVYGYGDIANNLNANPGLFPHEMGEYIPKAKGTYSKNFPTSLRYVYRNEGRTVDNDTYNYIYTLDSDGYPTQITSTGNSNQEKIYITYY